MTLYKSLYEYVNSQPFEYLSWLSAFNLKIH